MWEKNVEVRVKDFIEFFSKLDPELPVHLDKDGWDEQYFPEAKTPVDLIRARGLFYVRPGYVIMNN